MKTGIELIAAERQRQIDVEGWTPEHDDQHDRGELATAAACYATEHFIMLPDRQNTNRDPRLPIEWIGRDAWPWSPEWDKRRKHDRLRQLTIAGALIAAEIDRLQRAKG